MLLLNQFYLFLCCRGLETYLERRGTLRIKLLNGLEADWWDTAESLYTRQVERITGSILNDDSQPLHSEFQLFPSERRFVTPHKCRTKRYKNSFVPAAITQMNKNNNIVSGYLF